MARTRRQIEVSLAAVLGRELADDLIELIEALGDPPDVSRLSPALWSDMSSAIASALATSLMESFLLSADATAASITGFAPDYVSLHEAAAMWSADHAFSLAQTITAQRQAFVRAEVERFFRLGNMTIGDLADRMSPMFGPVHAEMIAQTETTAAWVEGNRHIWALIDAAGLRHRMRWRTAFDEKVCPICKPLNGVPEQPGGGYVHPDTLQVYARPPAHVRCRCEEEGEIVA